MATKAKFLKLIFKLFMIGCLVLFAGLYVQLFSPFTIPPKICRGLPSSFAEADKVFQERMQREFPDPVQEEELVDTLKRQGFMLHADSASSGVYFRKQVFPCLLTWDITWDKGANGSVKNIKGSYHGVCL